MKRNAMMPTTRRRPGKALLFLALAVLVALTVRDPIGAADTARRLASLLGDILDGLTKFGSALSS